jgi:UDP-N-acetylmuramate dehydrogenase
MQNVKQTVSLKERTTLKIGGPADFLVEVTSEEELIEALELAQEKKLPFLVIGEGSNLLISDDGFPGLVIKNNLTGIFQEADRLKTKTGTTLQQLVDDTLSHHLAGLQKLIGIPGTVGGAVYGNAGAYGQTISDHLVEVICLDPKTLVKTKLTKDDCHFFYRDSGFKKNDLIILEVTFQLEKTSTNLKEESAEVLEKRLKKYKPGILCPGSFFKNVLMESLTAEQKQLIPKDRDYFGKVPAWFFLDEVGAKGDKLGQIEIADFHGNLFMNLGNGSAADFYALAKKYHQKVIEKFGISLEPEVQFVNLPLLK